MPSPELLGSYSSTYTIFLNHGTKLFFDRIDFEYDESRELIVGQGQRDELWVQMRLELKPHGRNSFTGTWQEFDKEDTCHQTGSVEFVMEENRLVGAWTMMSMDKRKCLAAAGTWALVKY